jgi:hypothetical protein
MRADKIVSICETMAISSAKLLCERYPILNNLIPSDQDWNFLVTIAAVGACILNMPKPAFEEDSGEEFNHALTDSIDEWHPRGHEAFQNMTSFVDRYMNEGIAPDLALGMWVIWNLKGSTPTEEELGIASVLGTFLFLQAKETVSASE